ncbi:hypothetical protein K470DRAFT_275028 [Piedraia hortae CBS 480.64]|uniref:Uncharacterized protein n=1 Tax=Piedraia hortae CBS 480.64 TaxID=1314780 RepID=A0A6A7C5E2_9PEZI|nr:hypothetical protein K470DRAFT_275028 [Piedraia hortae CBS 480.64]
MPRQNQPAPRRSSRVAWQTKKATEAENSIRGNEEASSPQPEGGPHTRKYSSITEDQSTQSVDAQGKSKQPLENPLRRSARNAAKSAPGDNQHQARQHSPDAATAAEGSGNSSMELQSEVSTLSLSHELQIDPRLRSQGNASTIVKEAAAHPEGRESEQKSTHRREITNPARTAPANAVSTLSELSLPPSSADILGTAPETVKKTISSKNKQTRPSAGANKLSTTIDDLLDNLSSGSSTTNASLPEPANLLKKLQEVAAESKKAEEEDDPEHDDNPMLRRSTRTRKRHSQDEAGPSTKKARGVKAMASKRGKGKQAAQKGDEDGEQLENDDDVIEEVGVKVDHDMEGGIKEKEKPPAQSNEGPSLRRRSSRAAKLSQMAAEVSSGKRDKPAAMRSFRRVMPGKK